MLLAILKELVAVIITPRAEERVPELVHPPLHRFERLPEGRGTGDVLLGDPGQLGAKLSEFGVADRADEGLELGLDFERAGTLHDGPDLDNLHLMARHGPIVGAGGLQVYNQIVVVRDLHATTYFLFGVTRTLSKYTSGPTPPASSMP